MIALLTVVPAGQEAMSAEVARVIDLIDQSGLTYQLTSMGTIIEGDAEAVWTLVRGCHEKMRENNTRVVTHLVIDDRDGVDDAMQSKVGDIEKHLSRKLKT